MTAAAPDPDVTVVAVSWNTASCLPQALDSLAAASQQARCEVVVVDNGSDDGSPTLLAARRDVELIALEHNTGFTHAANVGASAGTGRYILLLNPDVTAQQGSVDVLVALLDARPDAWGATPWFLHSDGRPQHFWHRLPSDLLTVACFTRLAKAVDRRLGFPLRRRRKYEDMARPDGAVEIDAAGAAFLLVRRTDFDAVGGFDERYFNFGQDTDFARAQRRRGKVLLGTGAVAVTHEAGVTFKTLPWGEYDGQLLQALLGYLDGEPRWRRTLGRALIRLDLLLPSPDRDRRRRRALEPLP